MQSIASTMHYTTPLLLRENMNGPLLSISRIMKCSCCVILLGMIHVVYLKFICQVVYFSIQLYLLLLLRSVQDFSEYF